MSAKQSIWIDSHFGVASQCARTDANALTLTGFDDRPQLLNRRQNDWRSYGRQRVCAPPEHVARVLNSLLPKSAKRIDTHAPERVRQIDDPKILDAPPLRKCGPLDGQPLNLPHNIGVVHRDQDIAIDPWKRPSITRVESDGFWCLDIKKDLDLIRRNEVDSPNS
jgi:hypothetical protein